MMKGWAAMALPMVFLVGCAPAYRPPAAFVPLLDEQGDVNVAAHLGTGGAEVDAAYAVADSVSVRGGFQGAGYASEGHYGVATVGVGLFGGETAGPARWGVALEGGGGLSRGVSELTVTTETTGGVSQSDTTVFQNSGGLAVAAIRPEIGVEAEGFALASSAGVAYHTIFHNDASDGSGMGHGVMFEPVVVARAGPAPVSFEGFFGMSLPIFIEGEVGLPVPIMMGIGLTIDGSTR